MVRLPLATDNSVQEIPLSSPRILFVDDHAIVRHGVSVLLNGALGNRVIKAEAESALEAINILNKQEFDLIIVDISMPVMNGLELLAEIKSKNLSNAPVLVYSMYTEEQFAVQAFSLGAAGYVAKHAASSELVGAVKKILSGGRYVSEALSQLLLDHLTGGAPQQQVTPATSSASGSVLAPVPVPPTHRSAARPDHEFPIHKLSKKEIEVLVLFSQGLSPKEIGEELGRSEKTVSAHKLAAMNKIGTDDFSEILTEIKRLKREGKL